MADIKQRVVQALNRSMLYCLRVANGEPCVTVFTDNRRVFTDELYETIIHLRSLLPNKDEAQELKHLVETALDVSNANAAATHNKTYLHRSSRLAQLAEKLEVLSGQD